MAVIPMQKIRLYGMKKDLKKVLGILQEGGIMQIEEIIGTEKETELLQSLEKEDHDVDYRIANIDFALKTLAPYAPKKPIWAGKTVLSPESALGTLKEFSHEKIAEECQKTEERRIATINELKALESELTLLAPWTNLKTPLNTPRETETVRIIYGAVPTSNIEILKNELHKISTLSHCDTIMEDKSLAHIVIVMAKANLSDAKALFMKTKFIEIDLPMHDATVAEHLKTIDVLKKKLKETEQECAKAFYELAKHFENLQIAHDVLLWKKEEQTTREKLKGTEYSFVLTGWMPKEAHKPFAEKLKEKNLDLLIETITPSETEQPPVLLRNTKIAWPFESVTRLYGLPLPHEIDPTPFLATFFIIFFALCLTDAGYGLILFLIMFVMLKFFNLPMESRGLVKLLMWGGLLTIVAGIPFGGYLGMTLEQAPSFLVAEGGQSFKGQIINATAGSGPLTFLILAFTLGIIQVLTGKLIDGYWKIKQGQTLDAFLDSFSWVVFILSIIGFGLAKNDILIGAEYAELTKWMSLGGVVFMILTQGRKRKGIIAKLGIGVLSLYGLVAYLGDILSYSRLMALGLSTGIIAFAMNTIAGLTMEMIPYVGIIFAIIVLILGHALNLALSALGAFIHSARLQFVEFFSKFMEGGGKDFKPFTRQCKYILIQ